MPAMNLIPVNGIVVSITPFGDDCCEQQVSIRTTEGINNFIVGPETYVQNNVRLRPGMNVTALYDGEQAVPLIYPPQYRAVFIGRRNPGEKVYAGYFDETLTSSDGSLQLNIDTSTSVVTANGQTFQCSPGGHTLIVYYSETTAGSERSAGATLSKIPSQTTVVSGSITPSSSPAMTVTGLKVEPGAESCCVARL